MALIKAKFIVSILAACSAAGPASAFTSAPRPELCRSSPSRLSNDASGGGIEEIEFRIYPDGRITEIVRGVKGKTCQEVTEAINKQLGKVVDSQPTEEMFEEEVVLEQTLEQKDGGWEGASSW
mmetsp:Transcript_47456/g.100846  ORF Transcript_47456/g.100846 Transcript_47456/m.100846 type:complete len:123 (-) Transcript_47456:2211-2579(-)